MLRIHPSACAAWTLAAAALPCSAQQTSAVATGEGEPASLPAVVVTGEKSERSLSRTAPSVSVFTARSLTDELSSSRQLLDRMVNVTSSGVQNLAPAVRGVDGTGPAQGSDAFLAGTRPRLNVVVDGRNASYNEIIFGDLGLWDVERVEFFRGAQSTLQGRNAIAGTLVYKTNDPSFEHEAGGRVLFGSRGLEGQSAVLSTPFDDQVAFRLALDRQRYDSFVRGYEGYPADGSPGRFEGYTARAKLLVQPTAAPGFRTLFTLSHTDLEGPQTEGVSRPFGNRQSSYPSMPSFQPRSTAAVVDTTWTLSDRYTFENRIVGSDLTVLRHAVPGDGNVRIDGNDVSFEPRLRFRLPDQSLEGFVGLYVFRAHQRDTIDLFGGGEWTDRTRTYAIYGEATVALRKDLELTLGGRYEQERRFRQGSLAFFTTDFDETYRTFLPKLSLAWHTTPEWTVGAAISRGYNGGNAAFTYEAPFTNYTFDPEYVWNLEGFTRASLLDGRLRLTGNVFYSRYRDMQVPFDLNPDPAIWAYVVRNADRAETYGTELGATWLAMPGLTLSGELGLLKTKISRYPDSGVQGNELARSPKATLTLDADWRQGVWRAGVSARYSTAYYSDITNVSRGRVSPGWLADVRGSVQVGPARLFAYVNNVFDSDRPILVGADPNAADNSADVANLPRPRTLGVGLEAWF